MTSAAAYTWADHQVFPVPGGALLFGVDQASLFAVDDGAREVLRRWRGMDPVWMEGVPEGDRQVLEDLRDACILVPVRLHRTPPAPRLDPTETPLTTLVLEVSQACNLRCSYCYAGGGTYGGEPRLLDPADARRAVRHLVDASGDGEDLTLVLFGGEPLLNLPAVAAAVEEGEARARSVGKRLHACLTTNGTLLTPEVVAFLARHRVGVSVSLDGPPEIHDANRPRADGGGTYDRVVAGLGELLLGQASPVAARVTLTPSQWGRIGEVFDHLLGLGFQEVGIAPASPVTDALLPSPGEEEALFREFSVLARRFRDGAEEGRVLPFSNLLDLLARVHRGQTRSVSCGAGYGYLAVDAGGRFFLCHRLAGEEAFAVGDLEEGPDPEAIRSCLAALAVPREELCSRCWARTLCSGGCHYENHLRETILGLPPGGNCRFIRGWLRLGLELYAELKRGPGSRILPGLSRRLH